MGLRIATNVSSIAAQGSLAKNAVDQTNTLGKLSSGNRINKASDDAAGLAMVKKLRAELPVLTKRKEMQTMVYQCFKRQKEDLMKFQSSRPFKRASCSIFFRYRWRQRERVR